MPGQDASVENLQEELSRTEEELVNARQENTYLADRIKELETEAMNGKRRLLPSRILAWRLWSPAWHRSVLPVNPNHRWP